VNASECSYCNQGDIIFDTNIELPKSVEDYVIKEEVEEEIKKRQTSATGKYDSSDSHLKMDD